MMFFLKGKNNSMFVCIERIQLKEEIDYFGEQDENCSGGVFRQVRGM